MVHTAGRQRLDQTFPNLGTGVLAYCGEGRFGPSSAWRRQLGVEAAAGG